MNVISKEKLENMKIYDEIDNLEQSLANYKRKSDFKKYEPYVNKDSLQSKALSLVNILAKVKAPKASSYKLRMAKLLADIEALER